MSVMFANSRNVAFEKAETGKRGSRLSYAPTMINTQSEKTCLLNSCIFPKNVGLTVEPQTVRPMEGDDLRSKASRLVSGLLLSRV